MSNPYCVFPQLKTVVSDYEYLSLAKDSKIKKLLSRITKRVTSQQIVNTALIDVPEYNQEAIDFYLQIFNKDKNLPYKFSSEQPPLCYSSSVEIEGGTITDVSFDSTYRPLFKKFEQDFDSYYENKKVYLRHWKHNKKSKGTALLVHGWSMGDNRLNALSLIPGYFYKLGLDCIIYELPYHGRRSVIRNGMQIPFPSSDIAMMNEGFFQSIHDLHAIYKIFKKNSDVGIIGMSMGGYIASLLSCFIKLNYVLLVVPLVSIPDAINHPLLSTCQLIDNNNPLCHMSFEDLKRITDLHSALNYSSLVPNEKKLIIGSKDDTVLSSNQIDSLLNYWQGAEVHWLKGEHQEQLHDENAYSIIENFILK